MGSKVVRSCWIGSESITSTFWYSNNKTFQKQLFLIRRRATNLCIGGGGGIHLSVTPPLLFHVVQVTNGPSDPDSGSNEPDSSSSSSTLQDNLKYLLNLGISSFIGAAIIKYGSAAVPDITRPNLGLALTMISTPPIIALLLLAKQSRNA